jgi:RHS repeat-associated protein
MVVAIMFGSMVAVQLAGAGPAGAVAPSAAIGLASSHATRHLPGCAPGSYPINCASGDFWHTFTDVSVSGRGPDLDLTRTYNSLNAAKKGIFGYGWTSSYETNLVVNGDGSITVTEDDGSQVTAEPNGSGGFTVPAWADSTLVANTGGTYTFTRQRTEIFTFTSTGQLTSIGDPDGDTTTLAYSSGKLHTVTDAAGRAITFTFGTNGLVSQVTDPDSQNTTYAYTTSGDLKSVTDPASRVTSFTYDTSNLLLTMKKPNAKKFTNSYDSGDRLLTQTDPKGLETTYAYGGDNFSSSGGTTTITDPHGNVEVQNFANGELMSDVMGSGTSVAATTSNTYDSTTLGITAVTDPNSHTSSATFDADGNELTSTDALGNTTTTMYNGFDEPLMVTDPKGNVTTTTYDANGNKLTTTTSTRSSVDADGTNSATGISCPSTSFCASVDFAGNVLTSTNPTSGSPVWTPAKIDTTSGSALENITCPSAALCVAVDSTGNVYTSTNPTGGASAWTAAHVDSNTNPLNIGSWTGLSCPSTTLCVFTDYYGNVFTSTNPTGGASTWTEANIAGTATDGSSDIESLSCPTTTLCVAGDAVGGMLTTTTPTGGASAWHVYSADASAIVGVSCPSASLCVAVDFGGGYITSANPATWSSTTGRFSIDPSHYFSAISCASTTSCVATDAGGNVFTSSNPTAGFSAWSANGLDVPRALDTVVCLSATLCVAGDNGGDILAGNVNTPVETTTYSHGDSHAGDVTQMTDPTGRVTNYTYDTYGDVATTTTYPSGIAPLGGLASDMGTGATTLPVSPEAVGDVLVLAVGVFGDATTVTSLSGGGVTSWTRLEQYADSSSDDVELWMGKVTTAGSSTITAAFSASVAGHFVDIDAQEFANFGSATTWTKDTAGGSGSSGSTTVSYPSLTPATSGELYIGFAPAYGSVGSGSTPGFTYVPDPGDNMVVYDPVVSSTVAPTAPQAPSSAYGAVGALIEVSGSSANTTQDVFDVLGRKVCEASPTATAASISCPSAGGSRVSGTTTYAYNADGQLTSQVDPLGNTTSNVYDVDGNETSTTDPNGKVTATVFDADDRTTSVTTGYGTASASTTSDAYDLAPGTSKCLSTVSGATYCTTTTDGNGVVTVDYFNAINQQITQTQPAADATIDTYDAAGNKLTSIDPDGNETTYTYDSANDLLTETEGYGTSAAVTTTYTYDADGNKLSMENGASQTTTYAYNTLNQLVSTTDALGHTTTNTYDASGNMATQTNPDGQTTTWSYNGNNQVTQINYSDGTTHSVAYTYNPNGYVATMTDGSGTATATYNGADQLTAYQNGAGATVSYGYDANGNNTTLTYATGKTVTNAYDSLNRLVSVTDWNSQATSFTYDANGDQLTATYPNGVTDTRTYNSANQLATIKDKLGTTTLASFSYTRDADSNITSETDVGTPGAGTTTNTYNPLQEVTAAGSSSFTYDSAKNLTKAPNGSTQGFNADDEACWSGSGAGTCSAPPTGATTYAYSQEGNRTATTPSTGTSDSYGWTQSNQLKSLTPSTGSATSYVEDGNSLLQSESTGSTTTNFTWNPQPSLPLMLSDGTNYYIYGNGTDPIEQIAVSGGATSYLQSDQLGSTRLITNSSGSVTGSFTFGAWGTETGSSGTATTPFLFAGEYYDSASGLYYMRARWYDPGTGAFVSMDPDVAQTIQPYSYADDNPIEQTDPSGDYPNCEAKVNNIHQSSHVGGTVNVVYQMRCSDWVYFITMTVALYKQGFLGWYQQSSKSSWTFEQSSFSINTAVACTSSASSVFMAQGTSTITHQDGSKWYSSGTDGARRLRCGTPGG